MKKVQHIIIFLCTILFINYPSYSISAQQPIQIKDLIGQNIYQTSTNISKEVYPTTSNTVIILNHKATIDAILVAPLASVYEAPILLTSTDELPTETKQELLRLKPQNIIIIGGETMISEKLSKDIKNLIPKATIERLVGKDRYDTCLMIAKKIDQKISVNEIYIGNGYSESDLISIAYKAAEDKTPIILTDKEDINQDIYNWLSSKKLTNAYLIGGESILSKSLMNSINTITLKDISRNRIYGKNRYETNAKIIEKFYYNKNLNSVILTSQNDYISAIIGAPLGAKLSSPIILVDKSGLSDLQIGVLNTKTTELIYTLGTNISDTSYKQIIDILSSELEQLPDAPTSKDVLFFVAHQDDEILSFSTVIKKYLDKDFNVSVVLLSDGSASKAISIINGINKVCEIHNYVHDTKKEGYKIDDTKVFKVDIEDLSKLRNDEYRRALIKLGVPDANIHISKYVEKDTQLTKETTRKVIAEYMAIYPEASVHTFYNERFSSVNHNDHLTIGQVTEELHDKGIIKNLYLHIEPNLIKTFENTYKDKKVYVEYPDNKEQEQIISQAMAEYCVWDPRNGKMAIGYHSVPEYFDALITKPVNYLVRYQ